MYQSEELLNTYLEHTCDAESALLKRINRETYLRETMPHMLSGHYQGRVLSFLSKMARPGRILEIGTFTGYATLCLAEGLSKDGEIHTIDINAEQEERVQGYFDQSLYKEQIRYHIGDALEVINEISGDFDLIFIDADKKRNLQYYELLVDRVPSGGLIMIDNVLWKGKVLQEDPDNQTKQILGLNEQLAKDQRVDKLILPIRDGLFVLRKK
ncbi:O-methyltransferase [Sphingobacterium spiritivorum]|uniref:O-methyltransferase n=1 Tax=Sphingobacterium spiritivorum ATCC 33861 TaxID=525373 RepID=D7VIZ0_SPHSI|nr:class I SAM-dependent methyltransferase [Sphingobacterium spiritivorum]EFK60042.1 O-methyltransferase [Sphingobacterium spiritivorum ATCC 33861]QQT37334.1 class I SAM-dependent methyltransferase [Sphingobacterium spiritivorum]WQD34122.1 class I SAM-dependent methyltransferase [Sphingobacterium spiritivorum]SUJ29800.1 Putative O-methyltransferase MSMEG_5073 [Sphingobacterium spiritivorum]